MWCSTLKRAPLSVACEVAEYHPLAPDCNTSHDAVYRLAASNLAPGRRPGIYALDTRRLYWLAVRRLGRRLELCGLFVRRCRLELCRLAVAQLSMNC